MHQIIESNLVAIQRLCQSHQVLRLDVFGSALRDDFDANSDVDLLVVFERGDGINAFQQYFSFKEALESLFEKPVDVVCYNAIRNPYFKQEVERSRRLVYAA